MSAGPIKAWRESHVRPRVSTPDSKRVCMLRYSILPPRAYCGRSPRRAAERWEDVTCADCLAARRADQVARL